MYVSMQDPPQAPLASQAPQFGAGTPPTSSAPRPEKVKRTPELFLALCVVEDTHSFICTVDHSKRYCHVCGKLCYVEMTPTPPATAFEPPPSCFHPIVAGRPKDMHSHCPNKIFHRVVNSLADARTAIASSSKVVIPT
jgi:hypothetical protein